MYENYECSISSLQYVWNYNKLPKNAEEGFSFALEQGLIPSPPYFKTRCKGRSEPPVRFSRYDSLGSLLGLGRYRCSHSTKCRPDITIAKDTWFEESRIRGIHNEIKFLYEFSSKYSRYIRECSDFESGELIAKTTIAAIEIVCEALSKMQYNTRIGGLGIIVEIDEAKFGRCKYHRDRIIEEHCVLGMIAEDSDDLRLVICPNNIRNSETLVPIILQHVEKGSIIQTDEWKAYESLIDYDYTVILAYIPKELSPHGTPPKNGTDVPLHHRLNLPKKCANICGADGLQKTSWTYSNHR